MAVMVLGKVEVGLVGSITRSLMTKLSLAIARYKGYVVSCIIA